MNHHFVPGRRENSRGNLLTILRSNSILALSCPLDPVYTVIARNPHGHGIKLNSFNTSVALKFVMTLQNLTTTNHEKSSKSKYDRQLTEFDVMTSTL